MIVFNHMHFPEEDKEGDFKHFRFKLPEAASSCLVPEISMPPRATVRSLLANHLAHARAFLKFALRSIYHLIQARNLLCTKRAIDASSKMTI